MAVIRRRVVRAYRPCKTNNHPAVILQIDRGFVHAINGTSHPTSADFRQSPNPIEVVANSKDARAMGLSATTYFFRHRYCVLTDREFEDWRGGGFSAPLSLFQQLLAMVQDQMVATAPRFVLPAAALTFEAVVHDENE